MTGKNDARGGRKRGPQASPRRDLSIGGADSETTAASERETAPQTQFKCPQSDGLLGPSMPADNANGARLRALYPLLFGESDLGADL